MEKAFWLERWKNKEIGFHKTDFNPSLLSVQEHLQLKKGQKVLVPLCGKSLDMIWFANLGMSVLGVEVSQIGCEEFFTENKIRYTCQKRGNFVEYVSPNVRIWCGDFFEYESEEPFDLIYDRASNIALPPGMREKYYAQLLKFLGANTKLCLIAIEYEQEKVDGPPFSVSEVEIRRAYDGLQITKLSDQLIDLDNPKFKGVSVSPREKIYLITNP